MQVVKGKNKGYGLPADIWSLGCTVLEMLTGQLPYRDLECVRAILLLFNSRYTLVPHSEGDHVTRFCFFCLKQGLFSSHNLNSGFNSTNHFFFCFMCLPSQFFLLLLLKNY